MKLMFNKKTYEGHWFNDDEFPDDFTDKIPPHTGVEFDESSDGWKEIQHSENVEESEFENMENGDAAGNGLSEEE